MSKYPDYDELTPSEFDATWQSQEALASLSVAGDDIRENCIIANGESSQATGPLPLEIRLPAIVLVHELQEYGQEVKNDTLLAYLEAACREHPKEMISWLLEVSQAQLPPKRSVASIVLGRAPDIHPKWLCPEVWVESRTHQVVVIRGTVSPVGEPAA